MLEDLQAINFAIGQGMSLPITQILYVQNYTQNCVIVKRHMCFYSDLHGSGNLVRFHPP